MTKRICWHLIQNCNTRKVNRNLYTAYGLRSFYRPSVLCDRAFVCHVDDAADCTAVSPSTGAGAVRAGRGLNRCWFFWITARPLPPPAEQSLADLASSIHIACSGEGIHSNSRLEWMSSLWEIVLNKQRNKVACSYSHWCKAVLM